MVPKTVHRGPNEVGFELDVELAHRIRQKATSLVLSRKNDETSCAKSHGGNCKGEDIRKQSPPQPPPPQPPPSDSFTTSPNTPAALRRKMKYPRSVLEMIGCKEDKTSSAKSHGCNSKREITPKDNPPPPAPPPPSDSFMTSPATPAALRKMNYPRSVLEMIGCRTEEDKEDDEVNRIVNGLIQTEQDLRRLRADSSCSVGSGHTDRSTHTERSTQTDRSTRSDVSDVWDGIEDDLSLGKNNGESSELDLQSRMDVVETQIRAQKKQACEQDCSGSAPAIPSCSSLQSGSQCPPPAEPLISERTLSGRIISSMALQDLEIEKRNLKRRLQKFDAAFYKRHGRAPAKADKEPIRTWYDCYNALKARIGMLERGEVTIDPSCRTQDMLESIAEHSGESDDSDDEDKPVKAGTATLSGLLDVTEESEDDQEQEPSKEETVSLPLPFQRGSPREAEHHTADDEGGRPRYQDSVAIVAGKSNKSVRQQKEHHNEGNNDPEADEHQEASLDEGDITDTVRKADLRRKTNRCSPTSDCTDRNQESFVTMANRRLSYRKSGVGPTLPTPWTEHEDVGGSDNEEDEAKSDVNDNEVEVDDSEAGDSSLSSTAALDELEPSSSKRLIRQTLAKTESAPITQAVNAPNISITPPSSPDRSTDSGSDMSPSKAVPIGPIPIAVLLMDVRRNKYELLRLDVKWDKFQVGDVLDAVTSAIDAEEEERCWEGPPLTVCVNLDVAPATPSQNDGAAAIGQTTLSPLSCPGSVSSSSSSQPPGTIDIKIKQGADEPSIPAFKTTAEGPGGIKVGSWQVHYDGLIQCREGGGSDSRMLLINCIGLSRYEVTPYEVFVAKPVGMSAKETSKHANTLMKLLVQEGMLHTKTEEAKKCVNETVTILSDEAKNRAIVFVEKKKRLLQAKFLIFSPPFGPMASETPLSNRPDEDQSEIPCCSDAASAKSSVGAGSGAQFFPFSPESGTLSGNPFWLFPTPDSIEEAEIMGSSLPSPIVVDPLFPEGSAERQHQDYNQDMIPMGPGSFGAAIGYPVSDDTNTESIFGDKQILLMEEDARAVASYRRPNAWRCSQEVMKQHIKSLGSIAKTASKRSMKNEADFGSGTTKVSLKNSWKKQPGYYPHVDDTVHTDGVEWDERTFTTFNEEPGDARSVTTPSLLAVLSEDTEDSQRNTSFSAPVGF